MYDILQSLPQDQNAGAVTGVVIDDRHGARPVRRPSLGYSQGPYQMADIPGT